MRIDEVILHLLRAQEKVKHELLGEENEAVRLACNILDALPETMDADYLVTIVRCGMVGHNFGYRFDKQSN